MPGQQEAMADEVSADPAGDVELDEADVDEADDSRRSTLMRTTRTRTTTTEDADDVGEVEAGEVGEAGEASADDARDESRPSVADLEQESEIAADYIEGLLDVADLDGDIDMDVEGERAFVSVVGATLDELVGQRGEVLEALQELTRLAVHRQTGNRTRMMLDVGGYRQRRRAELAETGRDAADEVKRTGEPKRLWAMNPFERKIVHDAVAAARACAVSRRARSPTAASSCCRWADPATSRRVARRRTARWGRGLRAMSSVSVKSVDTQSAGSGSADSRQRSQSAARVAGWVGRFGVNRRSARRGRGVRRRPAAGREVRGTAGRAGRGARADRTRRGRADLGPAPPQLRRDGRAGAELQARWPTSAQERACPGSCWPSSGPRPRSS